MAESITTLSTKLPSVYAYMACGVVGTKCYLFGGLPSGKYSTMSNKIYVFDTETNTLTTLSTTLPSTLCHTACGVVTTKIYLFGGYINSSNSYLNTILLFDSGISSFIPIEITYNGETITLEENKKAVIKCANAKMVDNVVIKHPCTIIYNGTKTILEEGKIATLECNGKKMKSNVVVSK